MAQSLLLACLCLLLGFAVIGLGTVCEYLLLAYVPSLSARGRMVIGACIAVPTTALIVLGVVISATA